ncbi:MAG: hypothetical protein L0Y79_02080 [Chlorobi bacterium]|nr:hypothetical protein [Chlorobiota bacterium]MCI0716298.1 hypothetical protein [Chlorobiota bacterium]
MGKHNKPKTVFASSNNSIISVAKSLLSDAGIVYELNNDGMVQIQVSGDEDVIRARKILLDLEELDFKDER